MAAFETSTCQVLAAWKNLLNPTESRRYRQQENNHPVLSQPSHLESRAVRVVNGPVHFLRGVGAAHGREGKTEKQYEKEGRETPSASRFEKYEATHCMPATYEAEAQKTPFSIRLFCFEAQTETPSRGEKNRVHRTQPACPTGTSHVNASAAA